MALVINSNISSLNAQRQLVKSGGEMAQAMERLSSGKRINTAADDAAGLAITNRQTAQIKGLDRAVANANDGISLIQTAEGALDETTNILQRMRELSIQSANGIYEDKDRATLDAEVQQLKAEIDRIAETTTFNGKNLFDGSAGKLDLQIGSQSNQTVSVEIGKMDTKSLGGVASGDVVGAALASNDLLAGLNTITKGGATDDDVNITMFINNQDVGDLASAESLNDALATINKNISGVEVSAFTEMAAADKGTGIIRGGASLNISLANADGSNSTFQIKDTGSMNELVDKINSVAQGQLQASLNDDGKLVLSSQTGAQIAVADNDGATAAGLTGGAVQGAQLSFTITDKNIDNVDIKYTGGTVTDEDADPLEITPLTNAEAAAAGAAATGVQAREDGDITGNAITAPQALVEGELKINGVAIGAAEENADAAIQAQNMADAINDKSAETGVVASVEDGALKLNSVGGTEISIEATADAQAATGLLETNNSKTQGNSVSNIDISTQAGAQKAIDTIDTALEQINSSRADMGAMTNRLEFTVSNLMNVSENTSAARSRIQDADFAAETANLSRAQVLQQASQAMLAQANAAPQQVLSLLR